MSKFLSNQLAFLDEIGKKNEKIYVEENSEVSWPFEACRVEHVTYDYENKTYEGMPERWKIAVRNRSVFVKPRRRHVDRNI